MNLVKTIDQFDNKHLFFCEPIKNNIMNDGNFIRILYSTPTIALNGIYLLIELNDITCEKYYNKYKCMFNISTHKDIINQLKTIEEDILNKYKTNKIATYKIHEQIKCGYIKIFSDIGHKPHNYFILKISGIWETNLNFGLTYKFITPSEI
jgi:Zn-dependent M16 (insulinase) family peptidase